MINFLPFLVGGSIDAAEAFCWSKTINGGSRVFSIRQRKQIQKQILSSVTNKMKVRETLIHLSVSMSSSLEDNNTTTLDFNKDDDLEDSNPWMTWFPLCFTAHTCKTNPTRHNLLGAPIVVWHHHQKEIIKEENGWYSMLDICPHRLVPLSEGRIIPQSGDIECPYHGWTFDGQSGNCTNIPQQRVEQRKQQQIMMERSKMKGCATSLPCVVRQGILWVHTAPLFTEKKCKIDPYDINQYLVPEMDIPGVYHIDYFRDLPMEYSNLLENVLDPSHLPFTHHKTISRRPSSLSSYDTTSSSPISIKLLQPITSDGIVAEKMTSNIPGRVEFKSPHLVLSETNRAQAVNTTTSSSSSQTFRDWNVAYAIPTLPGQCRLMVRIVFEISKIKPKPLKYVMKFVFQYVPKWILHVQNHVILEDDNIFLHHQMHTYHTLLQENSNNKTHSALSLWKERTFLPTDADVAVKAFHLWKHLYGKEKDMWTIYTPSSLSKTRRSGYQIKPKKDLVERKMAHTDLCSTCSDADKRLKRYIEPTLLAGMTFCTIRILSKIIMEVIKIMITTTSGGEGAVAAVGESYFGLGWLFRHFRPSTFLRLFVKDGFILGILFVAWQKSREMRKNMNVGTYPPPRNLSK